MKFNVDEIASVLTEEIQNYQSAVDLNEVGRVLEIGDGIARVYGLANAMAGEQLEFSNGQFGQVFNLEESSVGVVIFGTYLDIKEGDEVRRTGNLLSIPCGEALIGRVVDPLGGEAGVQDIPARGLVCIHGRARLDPLVDRRGSVGLGLEYERQGPARYVLATKNALRPICVNRKVRT